MTFEKRMEHNNEAIKHAHCKDVLNDLHRRACSMGDIKQVRAVIWELLSAEAQEMNNHSEKARFGF